MVQLYRKSPEEVKELKNKEFFLFLLALAILLPFPILTTSRGYGSPVREKPAYIYLTCAAPDTAHTINVSWRTYEAEYVGKVLYDIEPHHGDPEAYAYSAEGDPIITPVTLKGAGGYIHHVELTGLKPDTTYYFICGHPDYWYSDEHSFKTAPVERKDIRFVVGGDSRWDPRPGYPHPDWPGCRDNVTKLMASYNPDFAIFIGDYIWNGEYQEEDLYGYTPNNFPDSWDNWLGAWYKYARTSDNRLIPMVPVIGNHEVTYPEPSGYDPMKDASNYYMLFVFPGFPGDRAYYSLNWGPDLHITILDSEILAPRSSSWDAQTEWLGQDLNQSSSLWNIAADHRPPLDDADLVGAWTPEFDSHHLDLMFSGHQHYYERSHPINLLSHQNSLSPESFESPENGTIYVVSGGWGAPLNGGSNWYSAVGPIEEYHFTLVDTYENGTLQFKAINSHNEIIDNFTLQKSVQPQPGEGGIPILPVAVAFVIIVCIIVIFLYYLRR